jgi:hypothetical protein
MALAYTMLPRYQYKLGVEQETFFLLLIGLIIQK